MLNLANFLPEAPDQFFGVQGPFKLLVCPFGQKMAFN